MCVYTLHQMIKYSFFSVLAHRMEENKKKNPVMSWYLFKSHFIPFILEKNNNKNERN